MKKIIDSNQDQLVSSLMNLLEDEDTSIAITAMEKLLSLGDRIEPSTAVFQETDNPLLRSRIHQLENIVRIRKERDESINKLKTSSLSLEEGISQINALYNPKVRVLSIQKTLHSLSKQMPKESSLSAFASWMRREEFTVSEDSILDSESYLIEDALSKRTGSSILLASIAKILARRRKYQLAIIVHRGRHFLMNRRGQLLDPSSNWKIFSPREDSKFRPYKDTEVWTTILCQLFISTVLEGIPRTVHRIAFALSKFTDGNAGDLPYPLGR